jgi:hypothetical protein
MISIATYGPSKSMIGSIVLRDSLDFFRGLSVEVSRPLVLLRDFIGVNCGKRMLHKWIDHD